MIYDFKKWKKNEEIDHLGNIIIKPTENKIFNAFKSSIADILKVDVIVTNKLPFEKAHANKYFYVLLISDNDKESKVILFNTFGDSDVVDLGTWEEFLKKQEKSEDEFENTVEHFNNRDINKVRGIIKHKIRGWDIAGIYIIAD